MTDWLPVAAALLSSYVLGSVPTGLWLGLRLKNIDIREHGSKNIGATNTLRVLGKPLGAIALIGDIAKGAVAVLVFARFAEWEYAPIICGLAAIAGHTWSLFLKFKGGKGVATSAGVFLGLCPVPTLIALAAFIIVVAATSMVSAGSITAAIVLTIAIWLLATDPLTGTENTLLLRAIATAVALIVIIRHRTNIQRILAGNENKL